MLPHDNHQVSRAHRRFGRLSVVKVCDKQFVRASRTSQSVHSFSAYSAEEEPSSLADWAELQSDSISEEEDLISADDLMDDDRTAQTSPAAADADHLGNDYASVSPLAAGAKKRPSRTGERMLLLTTVHLGADQMFIRPARLEGGPFEKSMPSGRQKPTPSPFRCRPIEGGLRKRRHGRFLPRRPER